MIDDELGLAEVAKLITQGEMRARPLTITFQNICFSTVEKENDFMLREDVLARSIMVKEMESKAKKSSLCIWRIFWPQIAERGYKE